MTQSQHNNSPPQIALIIPAQQASDSSSFPTSEKGVSKWLLAAAGDEIDSRVSALITALKHSNRVRNTPAERLKILDVFVGELQQLLPDLRTRFAEANFPQSASAESAFSQTALLLLEISYGYKISLIDALKKRGTLTQKVRVHTIYRAIKAIGDCGLHHSLNYRQWPAKSWRDLNTLLLLAEHEKAHEISINNGSALQYPETIQGLYIGYTLLNACDTKHLQRHEISAVFSSLCNSAEKFRLTKTRNQSSAHQDYSVALNSANAPAPDRFSTYPDNAKLRYLALEPLMSLFSTGLQTKLPSGSLGHHQQRHLIQTWLKNSKRKSPRCIRNTIIFAQSGLENIAATLNAASSQRKYSDLFSTHWIMLNQSHEGIGLQAGSKDKHSTGIGELMAYGKVQSGQGVQPLCQAGVVRWLSSEKNKPARLGVETIADRVECVTLAARDSQPSDQDTRALIGINPNSTDNQVILMVTRKRVTSGESITLSVGASSYYHNCIVPLGDRVDHRGNFDCFKLGSIPFK